jgi:hypothetical protein
MHPKFEFDQRPRSPRKYRGSQFSYQTKTLTLVVLLLLGMVWIASSRHHNTIGFGAPSLASSSLQAWGKKPRIAIVTFVTSQPSYMYLSLKNKARKFLQRVKDTYLSLDNKAC